MARTPVRLTDPPEPPAAPPDVVELPGERPDPRRLQEAADRLNKSLAGFEKALADLKLGVSASIVLDQEEDGDWIQYLVFRKVQGAFKLVVESGQDGIPESFNTTPITSSSRETRLRAVEALPDLYKKLLNAFDDEIKRVNESITRVEELERALRAKAAKP